MPFNIFMNNVVFVHRAILKPKVFNTGTFMAKFMRTLRLYLLDFTNIFYQNFKVNLYGKLFRIGFIDQNIHEN